MLKLGLIGTGGVVLAAHVPPLQARQDVQVVAIADGLETNRIAAGDALGCAARFDDYRHVLDIPEIQAVDICLPHHLHEAAVLDAFAAEKDVLLEKPIALNLEQADRMMAAAKQYGRKFYVSLNQRFYPAHQRMKEILVSGEWGRPFLALTRVIGDEFARMNDPVHWKGSWDCAGGGALADTGTHIIDLLLWWFGRPRTISCQWGRLLVEPEHKGDDNVLVTLEYPGLLANILVSYSAQSDPWSEHKEVYFRDDSIHITMAPDTAMWHGRGKQPLEPVSLAPVENWWTYSVGASIDHFLDCLQGKAAPAFGPEAARETLEIILLAYQAAKEARTLTVPELK